MPRTLPLPMPIGAKPKRARSTTSWRARRLAVIAAQRGRCKTCDKAGVPFDVVLLRPGVLAAYCRSCRRYWNARSRCRR
jgi:hypothetical protein